MKLFSRIFSFLKQEDEEEEEKKEVKRRKERKKALASAALMLMLLVSVYAEPAAAWSWPKPDWKGVGNFIDTLKNNIIGGAGGALAGAKVGASIGAAIGGPVGAAIGAAVGGLAGYIIGSHIEQSIKDKIAGSKLGQWLGLSNSETGGLDLGGLQDYKNITTKEFQDDTPVKNALIKNITDETDQAAYQDMQILLSKLQSSLVAYDLQASGDSGELRNEVLKGPATIYGFSAFPVVFEFQPTGNPDIKDPVNITRVKIYVKDQNGNVYWTRTWTNCGYGEEDTAFTFKTILKGPDPFSSSINDILNGQANGELINEIFSSVPEQFEIVIEVNGYREIYYYSNGQWVFDHKEYFNAEYSSLSAYRHIGGGVYAISGFAGSLPADYKDAPEATKFTAFQTKVAGASSDLVARLWSVPLHMLNATASYRFYIQANPGYFADLSPSITDEARIVVYRILKDGTWELAYAVPISDVAHLGELSGGARLDASVNYNADSETVSYRAFVAVKAWVTRDDGAKIPVWVLVEPAIAPVDPTITRVIDPYITQIGDLTSDNVISEADANQLKAIADSLITSLNSKIENAQYWVDKGQQEGKDDVVNYATLAIKHYEEAINYAKKLKATGDANEVLRFAEIVKEEETIGDYYLRAAQLAYYGNDDQAQGLVNNAKSIEENVAQYKGGINPLLAGLGLPSDWSNLRELLPFLLKILGSIVAIYIARKLFGSMGALVVLALVVIWLFGGVIGISL